jgi:hypothetical protein
MDWVYTPIDHGKAWLTVNQSPWMASEAHWRSAYGCSRCQGFAGTAQGGRGGARDSIWAHTRAREVVKGRAAVVRNGSTWSSVAARWKQGGGDSVIKMDVGWSCEGIGALI